MIDPVHLHPMIVHFPIALIIVGFVSEVTGVITKRHFFTNMAMLLLTLGALGLVASYVTGNLAGDGVEEAGALKTALETHEDAATLTLWLVIGITLARLLVHFKGWFTGRLRWGMVLVVLLGVLSIARTGYYGGELVFRHAAGVQLDFGLGSESNTDSTNEKEGSI